MRTTFCNFFLIGAMLFLLIFKINVFAQPNICFQGLYNASGLPENLEKHDHEIDLTLYADIDSLLPENQPVMYIEDQVATDILLNEYARITITFMNCDKSRGNSFGYFAYNQCNPPSSKKDIITHNIVYPNVSMPNRGGELFSGNSAVLGTFPPKTVISWFYVKNGWQNSAFNPDGRFFYAKPSFNANKTAGMIILKEENLGVFILGVENDLDDSNLLKDYNDMLFMVRVEPFDAVYSEKIASLNSNKSGVTETVVIDKDSAYRADYKVVESPDNETSSNKGIICEKNGMSYREFSTLKATLLAENDINKKKIFAKQTIGAYLLSIHQLTELLFVFPSENDKLEMVEFFYDHSCNQERFNEIEYIFSSNLKKYRTFLEKKGIMVSESNTTSNGSETQKDAELIPIPPHAVCQQYFDEKEYKKYINYIRSMTFSREKFFIMQQEIGDNCLLSTQTKEIVTLFYSESDKLEAAKHLYDYTIDKDNFAIVFELFEWDSSLKELNEYILGN